MSDTEFTELVTLAVESLKEETFIIYYNLMQIIKENVKRKGMQNTSISSLT